MTFFPGNPETIAANGAAIRLEGVDFSERETKLKGVVFDSWQDDAGAADAARSAISSIAEGLGLASTRYKACADALDTYSEALAKLEANYLAALETRNMLIWTQPWSSGSTPDDDFNVAIDVLIKDWNLVSETAYYAIVAATEGAHEYGGGGPFSQTQASDSGAKDLSEKAKLNGQVDLSDSAIDPLLISQGDAGDCWYLAGLMAIADSEDGAEMIRKNMVWDDKKNGYWVTLYRDGKPEKYFVDSVYSDGVGGSGRAPNWASVYESALVQYMGSEGGVNDDYGHVGFQILTGKGSQNWFSSNTDDIKRDLAKGKMVTASSNSKLDLGP